MKSKIDLPDEEIEVIAKTKDKIYKIIGITRNQYRKMEKKNGFDYQPFQKGFSCYPDAIEIKFKTK